MESEFPTTSSALGQLKEGDYDILQLSKKVDEIIKALPTKVNPDDDGSTVATKGKGKKTAGMFFTDSISTCCRTSLTMIS
jgi:hypothetical protein